MSALTSKFWQRYSTHKDNNGRENLLHLIPKRMSFVTAVSYLLRSGRRKFMVSVSCQGIIIPSPR